MDDKDLVVFGIVRKPDNTAVICVHDDTDDRELSIISAGIAIFLEKCPQCIPLILKLILPDEDGSIPIDRISVTSNDLEKIIRKFNGK